MVSGPVRAPPSLWKTGRSEPGGLGGAVSQGSALWFWKAKSEARGEGGSSEDGWGPKWGTAAFSSRTLGGHGRASAPRPCLGLSISPYLLGAATRDPTVFSRAFPSPFPSPAFGGRARELSTPSLPPLPETRRREGARHKSAGATVTFPPGSGGRPPLQSARARQGAAALPL